ncbi:MAG: radical SAM protein [Endomicrobiales bacterium]|nr:radical SAM protein [Endomicrobiales bacterium]
MHKIRKFLEEFGSSLEKSARARPVIAAKPKELHVELTFNCNSDCVMCNLKYFNEPGKEMSPEELVEKLHPGGFLSAIEFIVLSGGEPWLKRGFFKILSFFMDKYPKSRIIILSNLTDYTLAKKELEKIDRKYGFDRISIGSSLDGLAEVHDKIRGKKGTFDSLRNTLERLKKEFGGLTVSLNCTILPENCHQLHDVYKWCDERGYHVSFQVMVQKKETREFAWTGQQRGILDGQIDRLLDSLCEKFGLRDISGCELLLNEGLLSYFLSLHYIVKYVNERRRFFPGCPCGETMAMLDPYGKFYFCPVNKELAAGNIRDSSFDELWNGEKASEIRGYFNKRTCHCWLTCTNGAMIGTAIKDGKERFLESSFARIKQSNCGDRG